MRINEGKDKAAQKPGQIYDKETKKKVFKHQKIINQLLRVIVVCPMDEELKMVMRMRIWGVNPKIFKPLSCKDIAVLLNTRTNVVKAWEEDAVWNVKQYLTKTDVLDAIGKFHRDKKMKDLLNPKKRIIL